MIESVNDFHVFSISPFSPFKYIKISIIQLKLVSNPFLPAKVIHYIFYSLKIWNQTLKFKILWH